MSVPALIPEEFIAEPHILNICPSVLPFYSIVRGIKIE